LKLHQGQTKYLLRRLLQRRLPQSILDRKKQGFAAPVGKWLRGPLRGLSRDLLLDGTLAARGIFRDAAIRNVWDAHTAGTADHSQRLWSLLMLELWFREYIDGAGALAQAV
jgi:asparagine synthase (glutamine-hydrolysing)